MDSDTSPHPSSALPPNAQRVFKGKIFDVYQWEQKMFDGSITIFEKLWRPNTVVVIPVVGDKILIQKQDQPDIPVFISLPGGRCDGDEDPLEAAKRELLEETGYVSKDWKLWKTNNPHGKIIWTVYHYVARNCVSQKNPNPDAGEKITIKFISFEEFLMLSENQTMRDKELIMSLYKMRLHLEEKEKFRNLLFKK